MLATIVRATICWGWKDLECKLYDIVGPQTVTTSMKSDEHVDQRVSTGKFFF